MVNIKASLNEIELLKKCYKTMDIPINFEIKNDEIIIRNNEKENIFIMFNCVLDTFIKIGLLDNYEPNEIGFQLEELNKKINHELVKINSKKES